ncbi:hypothetical protein JCM9140_3602 [Halalkalibacter wakoensis JCM 9140]|uniref:Peptidase S8/S53 domain-containing protein n=1 Tax=Halalkalibacter wakoensis JCM 9140 TaxID=1236970 RepID=W4Q687_9BACI|nr:S8 family serine peptidase [Halalkalibacter wakoensis]GAE27455.1 hypothetical protein JCM9140_3602 [Halalkalibacter wakoensis JCM 9140]
MYHLNLLEVEKAHSLAGDNQVKVAIIDEGVDYDHPELKGKVVSDFNVQEPMRRALKGSHGTHVAGIVAAEKGNGLGGYGLHPEADIVSIDVFNGGYGTSDYAIAEGIMIAVDEEVDVINMSLGGASTPIMQKAVEKAIDAGVTIVAAAGNSASDYASYPAGYEGVISVGSTDRHDDLSYFSNYGSSIDVTAPGSKVYSSDYLPYKGSSFSSYDGTSMASPVVAGVASLLLSKHPDLTPLEVMYVLQQSAKDLGETGFDTTFGYGRVDPVAALQFDIEQIPTAVRETLAQAERAQPITLTEQDFETSGTITFPGETHYWITDVQAGEKIQLMLEGTSPYDYKAELEFYLDGEVEAENTITVNDVGSGEIEGYLFEAEQDGKVVVSVKDAYNKYHENGESSYTLTLAKYETFLEDNNTIETPVHVESLPFSTNQSGLGSFYLAGDEGDQDYYRFTVEEPKVVEISLSSIPGLNPTIHAYFAEEFDRELTEDMLEGLPQEIIDEMMDQEPWPFASANRNGIAQGETLTFEAMPGQEYVIEATSVDNYMTFYYDPFMMLMYDDVSERATSSHIPYELTIRGEVLPADEDDFPMALQDDAPLMMDEEEMEELPIANYLKKKQQFEQMFELYVGGGMYYFEGELADLLELARPYTVGESITGYFQYDYDIDLLKVEPTVDGIYHFDWNETETLQPFVEVYKVVEEDGEEYLSFVADSYGFSYYGMDLSTGLQVGLEGDETYVFMLSSFYFQPSLDQYEITSDILIENPGDAYEKNNTPDTAKDLPDYSFTANFALNRDVDMFYMEAKQDGVYGFHVEVLHGKQHEQRGVPSELYTTIDPMVMIVEDVKGDRELAPDSPAYLFDRGWDNEDEHGSFKVKEGRGYFIIIENWFNTPSLTPYRVTVAPAHEAKEKPVGTIPELAKPVRQVGSNKWQAVDFLAAGLKDGDVHYYSFDLDEKSDIQITLDVPFDLDGELTLYDKDGHMLLQSKQYGQGDAEVLQTTLEKGQYFIGVKDIEGNPSIRPYELTVDQF